MAKNLISAIVIGALALIYILVSGYLADYYPCTGVAVYVITLTFAGAVNLFANSKRDRALDYLQDDL